ncbi:hypothetical protein [Paenibacillus turpanensis]|uniref:hypothetical protein n=1 Tax=Paenibacillus turpanensis TaxID=2689078 RepID=UPI00140BBC52|nr:hypothetical protein [Paenibacillus turpanensis]
MMNTPAGPAAAPSYTGISEGRAKKRSYKGFLVAWVLLIAAGFTTAYYYTDYVKRQLQNEISRQTAIQLEAVQQQYTLQLEQTQAAFTAEIAKMQEKINALNDLLAFAKDNANANTDNSNQLYTQLQELKNQLNALQKQMEMLQ